MLPEWMTIVVEGECGGGGEGETSREEDSCRFQENIKEYKRERE